MGGWRGGWWGRLLNIHSPSLHQTGMCWCQGPGCQCPQHQIVCGGIPSVKMTAWIRLPGLAGWPKRLRNRRTAWFCTPCISADHGTVWVNSVYAAARSRAGGG